MDRYSNVASPLPNRRKLPDGALQWLRGAARPLEPGARVPSQLILPPAPAVITALSPAARRRPPAPGAAPAAPAGPAAPANKQVPPRWLALTRVAWVAVAMLALGLFVASLPERYQQLANPDVRIHQALATLNLSSNLYAGYHVALEIVVALVFSLVALIIFRRQSQDRVATVVAFMLVLAGTAMRPVVNTMDALLVVEPGWTLPIRTLTYLTWLFIFMFFCVFPDGRFTPRWTLGLLTFAALILVPWEFFPDSPLSPWTWSPLSFFALLVGLWGASIGAQIYRYRRVSDQVQRQQTRWVLYGVTVTLALGMTFYFARRLDGMPDGPTTGAALVYDLATLTGMYLALLVTPLTIGISILRYRLWGIDMLINRTLVYVPLTAILAGVYAASVTLCQKMFIAVTGDKSDAAIILTTLVLATTFTPIKNALQAFVDKRFKDALDPARVLKAFNEDVQEEISLIDARRITHRLLDEAAHAFGAQSGAVYLGPANQETPAHTIGEWTGTGVLDLPLETAGVRLGRLALGPRRHDAEYTAQDREMLQTTVTLVADAIGTAKVPGAGRPLTPAGTLTLPTLNR